METIGDRLRRLRTEQGITQQVIADAVGISRAAVAQWENGTSKRLRPDSLFLAAKALNVDPYYLQYGVESNAPELESLPSISNHALVSPEVQQLLDYFDGLTSTQRDSILATIKAQAEHNQQLMQELSGSPPTMGKVRRSA